MRAEKIKRTLAFAYVATVIAQVAEIGYNYLLYKSFPVADLGLFAWAAAVVVFFNMAIDLGLEPILTRKFGRDRLAINRAMAATFLPRVPVIVIGAAIATTFYAFDFFGSEKYWMLVLIGGQAIFNVSDGVCKAWLRANGRQTNANFLAAMIGVLKLSAIVALTRSDASSIYQLLVALLIIRAIVSILAYRLVASHIPAAGDIQQPATYALAGSLLKAGIVVGGIGVLGAVQNRLDWLLVSHFISNEALATYSLANKFYEISQLVVGAALATIYPWLCRADTDKSNLLILLKLALAGGAILGASGAILGPPLVGLLFAGKFAGIGAPLVILMIAVGFMASSGALYQLILANGYERPLLVVTVITTTLQAATNFWLIPRLGLTGAAIGMLVLVVLTTIGLSVVAWNHALLSGKILVRQFLFLAFFIAVTCPLVYFAVPVWASVSICIIVLVSSSWWLLFQPAERDILKKQIQALRALLPFA